MTVLMPVHGLLIATMCSNHGQLTVLLQPNAVSCELVTMETKSKGINVTHLKSDVFFLYLYRN